MFCKKEEEMSVYKMISLVGTSNNSWEDATQQALKAAGKSVRDLRVAEVSKLDVSLDKDGNIVEYRSKVEVSFKHEAGES